MKPSISTIEQEGSKSCAFHHEEIEAYQLLFRGKVSQRQVQDEDDVSKLRDKIAKKFRTRTNLPTDDQII